jgi:tRNA-dihydrouridine synthase 1
MLGFLLYARYGIIINQIFEISMNASNVLSPDMTRVVAPMVNQSDAPFRTLCLRYGATCAYTEMLYSDRIAHEGDDYLESVLPQCDHTYFSSINDTSPYKSHALVIQICGNNPTILHQAVLNLLSYRSKYPFDAIDLNLGCPQDRARDGLYGSFLLDRCHWPLVHTCVQQMCKAASTIIPIHCKIRVCEGGGSPELSKLEATIQFCECLVDAGAKLITIHGRTR